MYARYKVVLCLLWHTKNKD